MVVGIASFRWIQDLRQGPRAEVKEQNERASEPARRSILGTGDRVPKPYLGRWLHRYTLLLALSTWAAVITGALVTSHLTSASAQLEKTHLGVAVAVGMLAIGLAVWLLRARRQGWVGRLGWIVLAGGSRKLLWEPAIRRRGRSTLYSRSFSSQSRWPSRWSLRPVGPAGQHRSTIRRGFRYEVSRPQRSLWRYSKCPWERQSVTERWELRPISWLRWW